MRNGVDACRAIAEECVALSKTEGKFRKVAHFVRGNRRSIELFGLAGADSCLSLCYEKEFGLPTRLTPTLDTRLSDYRPNSDRRASLSGMLAFRSPATNKSLHIHVPRWLNDASAEERVRWLLTLLRRGYSSRKLALVLGVSEQTLRQCFTARAESLSMAERVCRRLHVAPEWLLLGNVNHSSKPATRTQKPVQATRPAVHRAAWANFAKFIVTTAARMFDKTD